jgi:hypothetical protein
MPLVGTPVTTLDYVTATAVSSPAAETAILSTDVVESSVPVSGAGQVALANRPVTIKATLNITAGTSATAVVIRCRQGVGTGGTQVGPTLTVSVTAASSYQLQVVFRDVTGATFTANGSAYTITVAETSATVAGTVNAIDVEVTD